MKRSYLTLNLTDLNDLPKMNRWLFKNHAPDTVSQKSGLYDINNNPIYEGDIVKVNLAEITSCDFMPFIHIR